MKKLTLLAIGVVAVFSLVGCESATWGLWPVSLQNNSDQTVVLRRSTGTPPTPYPMVTVAPHQTGTNPEVLPHGSCYGGFDIADTSGKQLRDVGKVCANETVVYP